jgi:hypothetical protein
MLHSNHQRKKIEEFSKLSRSIKYKFVGNIRCKGKFGNNEEFKNSTDSTISGILFTEENAENVKKKEMNEKKVSCL